MVEVEVEVPEAVVWWFGSAWSELELALAAAVLEPADGGAFESAPASLFAVDVISRERAIRRRLLELAEPHADVLAWACEARVWAPRMVERYVWPSVAIRTREARSRFGDAASTELARTRSDRTIAAVRAETVAMVRAAVDAWEAAS